MYATGLFNAEAGGGSSATATMGRVLAQAEAASEEMGVERAVKRALRGVADLVRFGEIANTLSVSRQSYEACGHSGCGACAGKTARQCPLVVCMHSQRWRACTKVAYSCL